MTAAHDGLAISVRLEDADARRALLGLPPTGPLTAGEVAHWQACLDRAWLLLVSRHRAAAEVLAAVLRVIVPVLPDPAARGISATSADAYGAVALSPPADHVELAVGLLHETQHSLLNAVQHLFDLHTEPRALGYSPWRGDPRPASGVLHGAYAYLAVTRFWRTEHRADPENRLAAFEFARWRAAVAATAESLLACDALTPAGHRFVTALRDEVRPWLAEPVDSEIARLATAARLDHELRWRLRNRAVDADQVAELAAAWRRTGAGQPASAPKQLPRPRPAPETDDREGPTHHRAPDAPAGSNGSRTRAGAGTAPSLPVPRLIPTPRRALENSARLDLIHRALTAGSTTATRAEVAGGGEAGGAVDQPGTRATAADTAFLRGDYGTALPAYQKAIALDLADDAAWSGLAIAAGDGPLRQHLELVAAVCRRLGDDHPDPLTLAAWISG